MEGRRGEVSEEEEEGGGVEARPLPLSRGGGVGVICDMRLVGG